MRHHSDNSWRGPRLTLWLLALCVGLVACAPATPEAAVEQSPPPVTATTPSATPVPTPSASAAEPPEALTTRIGELTVAAEIPRAGYDRDLFDHWVDLDGDCQDTRHEVLVAESRTEVSGCRIEAGDWLSYYDDLAWTSSSDVDVDHMVPLGEAWDSGAGRWSEDTRRRFANDLDDDRSLVAVTDNANQSKGDRDPAEWLPDRQVCRYAVDWVVVKTRWSLTVDEPERDALLAIADDCPDQPIALQVAPVEMDRAD